MKYYLVAGEASGDLHGSLLMTELDRQDPAAQFRFVGGNKMTDASGTAPFMHYSDMSFMGFLEVFKNLGTILENLKKVRTDITGFQPDVLILIDFPGFNLRLAKFAHKAGLPVFYFISPKVWAWNQRRVLKIKRDIDRMFVIFPFEVEFYKKWGMQVDYVGNPLMDAIEQFKTSAAGQVTDPGADTRPIVALLPGSRRQEIAMILPDMLSVIPQFPDYRFVIAMAPDFTEDYFLQYSGDAAVSFHAGNPYELLSIAQAALVTSGTATLETALLNIPEVVLYKTSVISYEIARRLIRIPFISLVNLIMNKEVIRELIQNDCNPDTICAELKKILNNTGSRTVMLENYALLHQQVGGAGAASRAAAKMFGYLQQKAS